MDILGTQKEHNPSHVHVVKDTIGIVIKEVQLWRLIQMEIGKKYVIIYDDKFNHPVRKVGVVKDISNNLITLDTGEVLNCALVIRAEFYAGDF